jgi:hypothetical protein
LTNIFVRVAHRSPGKRGHFADVLGYRDESS